MVQHINKICIADLVEDRIFISPAGLAKEALLEQLAKLLCQADNRLHFPDIFQQILAREAELSTTLDSGLSIPHVRLDGFDKVLAALAVLPEPLPDTGVQPIKAVFLFITPIRYEFFQTHLRVLSAAVEVLSPQCMAQLAACTTIEQVSALLRKAGPGGEMI